MLFQKTHTIVDVVSMDFHMGQVSSTWNLQIKLMHATSHYFVELPSYKTPLNMSNATR